MKRNRNKWRHIYFLFVLCLVIQGKKNIFNLNEINDKLIENGSPIVTPALEKQIFQDKIFKFYPLFTVVEKQINNEGNFYIQLEDVSQTTFHLWGKTHPKDPNYKFNASANTVHKCSDSTKCVTMNYCNSGNIENVENEEFSNKTVFLSWEINKDYIKFLFQYQNKTVFCQDTKGFPIDKIVLFGNKKQIYKISKGSFTYLNQNTKSSLTKQLINLDSAYSFYISHCFTCSFNIDVDCFNNETRKHKTEKMLPHVIYTNSFITKGWKKIIVGLKEISCTMNITLEHDKNQSIKKFWAITTINKSEKNMIISQNKCKHYFHQNYEETETTENYFDLGQINELFFDTGSPLITQSFEENIFTDKHQSNSGYEMIKSIVTDKGNLFIQTENILETIFHLNESTQGDCGRGYYKYNAAKNFVEKCFQENSCQELKQCKFAITERLEGEDHSNRTVFMSWRINKNILNLVFQYQMNTIFCEVTDGYAIEKILLVSDKPQKYAISNETFDYFDSKNRLNKTSVTLNSSYSFYIRQCLTCYFNITVACPNYPVTIISTRSELPRVIYHNSMFREGWKKIIVGLQGLECEMKIQTDSDKKFNLEEFWAITTRKKSQENMTIKEITNGAEIRNLVKGNSKETTYITLVLTISFIFFF